MNDSKYAVMFLLIFAVVLFLYGTLIAKTGSVDLLPYRAALSISGPEDVRRVGRIVCIVAAVLGSIMCLALVTCARG